MTYTERIKSLHNQAVEEFQSLLDIIEPLTKQNLGKLQIDITQTQLKYILDNMIGVSTTVKDCMYYLQYYPNKEKEFKQEIEDLDKILNFITTIEIKNKENQTWHKQ